jgi:hypothetical protein
MADVKISALPAASTPLAGTEVLPIVQGGTTDKVSVADLTAGRTVAAGALNVDGNVGIGTSSPGARLHVAGSSGITTQIIQSTGSVAARFNLQTTNDANGFINYDTGNWIFFNNSAGSAVERMRIAASGNVGIGTSSPNSTLHLYNATNPVLRLAAGADAGLFVDYISGFGANVNVASNFPLIFGTNNTERARITSGGEVYIAGTSDQGAFNLQVNGTGVWGAGAYVNGSDARIKDDIAPITSGLDVVAKLNPVQFRYKESWSKDRSLQPGFIAQELQEALADQPYAEGVVHQGPEYMSVSYQTLIPVLVKAVQELKAENDALKARIATLETR